MALSGATTSRTGCIALAAAAHAGAAGNDTCSKMPSGHCCSKALAGAALAVHAVGSTAPKSDHRRRRDACPLQQQRGVGPAHIRA